MEYTSIHVNGHLLSDEILRSIEQDETFQGNTQRDFAVDTTVGQAIDYAWGALRNDWEYFKSRSNINDPYGTRRVRDLMSALFAKLGYNLEQQRQNVEASGRSFDITYLDHDIKDYPSRPKVLSSATPTSILSTATPLTIAQKDSAARSPITPRCSSISTPRRMSMAS